MQREERFGQMELFDRVMKQKLDKELRGSRDEEAVLHTDGHNLLCHLWRGTSS